MRVERYLMAAISRPLLGILGVLTIIFASYTAGRFLEQAAAGVISSDAALAIIRFRVLIAFEVLAPVALYLAIFLGFGKLYHEQEMAALAAAGVPPWRRYLAVALLAVPLAIVVGGLSHLARPWAYAQAYQLEQQAGRDLDISHLKAGQFNSNPETGLMIRAQHIDVEQRRMEKVLLYARGKERSQLFVAREGVLVDPDPAHALLTLHQGTVYSLRRQAPPADVVASDVVANSDVANNDVADNALLDREADQLLYFTDLRYQLAAMENAVTYKRKATASSVLRDMPGVAEQAEWQWRASRGPTTFLLAMLAVPLSRTAPRAGRYSRLLPAALIFVAVYYTGGVCKNLIESGQLGLFPGMWWVPFLLLTGWLMLAWRERRQ